MANRNRGNASTTQDQPAVEAEATEAPVEATEQTEAPKAEDKPVDLTAFTEAVNAAVAEADVTTGEVPEASLAAVTAAYRALEGIKAKNAAKALVNEGMKDKMNSDDLAGARAYLNIGDNALTAAAGASRSERVPADPTEAFVQRVGTIQLAYGLAVANVPEGVKDNWNELVTELVNSSNESAQAYSAWLSGDTETRGDEPEVSGVVRNAAKLAQGRSAKAGSTRSGGGASFDGPRRDISKHIANAFEGKDSGTFLSIAEIRNTRSDEYGDNPPSAGAISARLFPRSGKVTVEGVTPETQNGKKGAVKA